MSHYLEHQLAIHGPSMHVVCASSGNAGISAAYASRALGLKCTVFLPEGVHPATTEYLKLLEAELVVTPGKYFAYALRAAEEAVKNNGNAWALRRYIYPTWWPEQGGFLQCPRAGIQRPPYLGRPFIHDPRSKATAFERSDKARRYIMQRRWWRPPWWSAHRL